MSDLDDLNAAFSKAHGTPAAVPTVGKEAPKGNPLMEFIKGFNSPTSRSSTFQDRVMQAITFGGMDNLTSAITAGVKAPFSDKTFGEVYNEDQAAYQKERTAQDEAHPIVGGAGTVVGSLIGPDPTAKLKLAGKVGQVGKSILSGGVSGGLQSFGEADQEDLVGRLKAAADGFMWGTAGGAVAGGVGSTVSRVVSRREGKLMQKQLDAMRTETSTAYDAALSTGELIPGDMLSKNINEASSSIRNTMGYRSSLKENKGLEALMEDLDNYATQSTKNGAKPIRDMDLATLDKIQQEAWTTYHNAKPGTQRHVLTLIKSLDKSMDEAAEQGSPLLKAARQKSRMERNTKMFDEIMKTAGRKAESGSGDYATRYKYAAEKILDSKKYSGFLNDEEKGALQNIIDGTTPGNVARFFGRFAPNSGNMASLIGMMTAYNNPVVGIPAMMGAHAAKKVSASSTKSLVDEARRVMSGSPMPTPSPQMEQLGPTIAKAGGQAVAPQMPSLLDFSGLTQPGQAANPTLMELNSLYKMQAQQQGQ